MSRRLARESHPRHRRCVAGSGNPVDGAPRELHYQPGFATRDMEPGKSAYLLPLQDDFSGAGATVPEEFERLREALRAKAMGDQFLKRHFAFWAIKKTHVTPVCSG